MAVLGLFGRKPKLKRGTNALQNDQVWNIAAYGEKPPALVAALVNEARKMNAIHSMGMVEASRPGDEPPHPLVMVYLDPSVVANLNEIMPRLVDAAESASTPQRVLVDFLPSDGPIPATKPDGAKHPWHFYSR